MYNRYVPQADGTYRRNRIQDAPHPEHRRQENQPHHPIAVQQETCGDPPIPQPHRSQRQSVPKQDYPQRKNPAGTPVSGFLRQLLPKDFDTGDLLVVILLLLMSADSCEDQNSALLTLALYLFM